MSTSHAARGSLSQASRQAVSLVVLICIYCIVLVCGALQAGNPKDQYLLLRALSEVLTSLAALPSGAAQLPPNCQSEVRGLAPNIAQTSQQVQRLANACVASGDRRLTNRESSLETDKHAAGNPWWSKRDGNRGARKGRQVDESMT